MPSASTISLNDGQATPVSHDFTPNQISPNSSTFVDKDSTTSAGQKKLILTFSPASVSRQTTRVGVRFAMPIEQTVDGVTSVAYTARFNGDVVIPDQMTQAQRDDLAAFISNALAHTVVSGSISDLDPVY